jgi:hypothetical protein
LHSIYVDFIRSLIVEQIQYEHSHSEQITMDGFGTTFLIIAVLAIVGAITVFWVLSRQAPRGAVLAVAVGIYIAGVMTSPGSTRVMVGVAGLLKFIGFIGGILGLVDLLRKRSDSREDLDFK